MPSDSGGKPGERGVIKVRRKICFKKEEVIKEVEDCWVVHPHIFNRSFSNFVQDNCLFLGLSLLLQDLEHLWPLSTKCQ